MVVPVSFNPNFFPDRRGKKITGRKDEQVNFEDYLLEKVEPIDSTPESARDQDEGSGRGAGAEDQDGSKETTTDTDSHGGERPDGPLPGRRIDLRA